jgi:two-component system, LytTR family, response regulator
MKVLIVEDEQMTAQRLEKLILEIEPSCTVLAQCESIEETVNWLKTHTEPDLIFLDIQLADGSSFEIFKQVDVHCPVIFTTAFDQYAIQAFKVNSIDYLLKPIKKAELANAFKKYKKANQVEVLAKNYKQLAELVGQQRVEYKKRFMIKIGQQMKVVNIEDVAYFYIDQKIVYLATKEARNYPIDFSLDQMENLLDPQRFFRINRAFIISIDSIEKMISYSKSRVKIKLKPECQLDSVSSTDRSGLFKEWLKGKY